MSKVIQSWIDRHEAEHGPYSAFAGFENELCEHDEALDAEWWTFDPDVRALFFEFVCGLLEREAGERE
jgi:hypothetical protein